MNRGVDRQKHWFPLQLLSITVVGLGVVFLLWRLGMDTAEDVFPHPADRTELRLEALQRQLEQLTTAGIEVPATIDQLLAKVPARMRETLSKDAWDRPVRLQRTGAHYELRSSGPDGAFDTSDDIVVRGSSTPATNKTRVP